MLAQVIVIVLIVLLVFIRCRRMSRYGSGNVMFTWTNQGGTTDVVEKWILTVKVGEEVFKAENAVDVSDGDEVTMKIENLPFEGQYKYNLSYKRFGSSSLFTIQEGTVSNDEQLTLNSHDLTTSAVNFDVDCVANYQDDTCPAAPGNNEPGCGTKAKTTRRWTITQPSQANGMACPPPTEEVECGGINPCGTCVEKEWSEWSECHPQFGNKTRNREPTEETYGGCMGDASKWKIQDIQPCPVDCQGKWDCSPCGLAPGKSENDGSHMEKVCTWVTNIEPQNGGAACPTGTSFTVSSEDKDLPLPDGSTQQVGMCPAPVPCTQSSSVGSCKDRPCEMNDATRYKTKTYKISSNPLHNGTFCAKLHGETEEIACGTKPACPPRDYYDRTANHIDANAYFQSADDYTVDECAKKCNSDSKCKAFMYRKSFQSHYCSLFDETKSKPGETNQWGNYIAAWCLGHNDSNKKDDIGVYRKKTAPAPTEPCRHSKSGALDAPVI